MDQEDAQEWVNFIGALDKYSDASMDVRHAVLKRFPSQFAMIAFWLNNFQVTGGEPIQAAGPPEECDLCRTKLAQNGLFIDGQIKDGRWSFMCMACFSTHGSGLGWGLGQLFRLRGQDEDGEPRWVCIAGGPPDSTSSDGTA